MFNILSLTQEEYSEAIHKRLGRGAVHARLIYSEWFKTGRIEGNDPAFNNAQLLLKQIIEITDFSLLSFGALDEQGETRKFLLKTSEGLETESVLIPMQSGYTLCVSSQVGCRMGCSFCETGRMGLVKQLSVNEIISQFFHARFTLGAVVRNVVFMGMGEPFDNYDAVMKAVNILTEPAGFGLGKSRVTLSTSGCVEGIDRLTREGHPALNLAVSINAPNDAIRNKLMPVNHKHDMQALFEAMFAYCAHPRREILIEYVMIQGVNDSLENALELASYLKGLRVKINLIPYNAQRKSRYQPPELEMIEQFAKVLRDEGYYTLFRQPKGRNIMAACGQLGNRRLRNSKIHENSAI